MTSSKPAPGEKLTEEAFVRAWIERERAKGLLDIKLFPHAMSDADAIRAFADVLREIDARDRLASPAPGVENLQEDSCPPRQTPVPTGHGGIGGEVASLPPVGPTAGAPTRERLVKAAKKAARLWLVEEGFGEGNRSFNSMCDGIAEDVTDAILALFPVSHLHPPIERIKESE